MMRTLISILISIAPFIAMALPVTGEKVTYTGTALKGDGLYEVITTNEVLSFDPEKKEYSVKNSFEQSAEGSPMGGYDEVLTIPGRDYFALERALPQLIAECGNIKSQNSAQHLVTSREVLTTPMGDLETCRVDTPYNVKNGTQVSQWFSLQTAPWPARTRVINMKAPIVVETTIQSITRPAPQTPPSEQIKPAPENKPVPETPAQP